jgi:hypothetical protein
MTITINPNDYLDEVRRDDITILSAHTCIYCGHKYVTVEDLENGDSDTIRVIEPVDVHYTSV